MIWVDMIKRDASVPTPAYQTSGAAGFDLTAQFKDTECLEIKPFETVVIPTGLQMAIPSGYCGKLVSRSGLCIKSGIQVINAPGLIDEDFRGEIMVGLINLSEHIYGLQKGDRIAQLLISPVMRATLRIVRELPETERGTGGLGSTGR